MLMIALSDVSIKELPESPLLVVYTVGSNYRGAQRKGGRVRFQIVVVRATTDGSRGSVPGVVPCGHPGVAWRSYELCTSS